MKLKIFAITLFLVATFLIIALVGKVSAAPSNNPIFATIEQVSALRAGGRVPALETVPHTPGTPAVASGLACTRLRRQSP